jgi:hypothetical protein
VARLSKTITIDDKPVTVYEVIPDDVLTVIDMGQDEVISRAHELLPKCVTLTLAEMKKMAPSDLAKVWVAFREVNAVFFSLVERLGIMDSILPGVRETILAEMNRELAKSLTEPPSSAGSAGSSSEDTSTPAAME